MNQRYPVVTQSGNGYCPAQVTPSTSKQVLTQDPNALGPAWETPTFGRYYGTDTTNTNAYVLTVAADFTLSPGVVVFAIVTNSNTLAPTLNVNMAGAKNVVNRAGAALTSSQLVGGTLFGVVYDGTSWRVITPIP